MIAMLALARATYRAVITRPFYPLTLLVFGAMIFLSQYVTLFAFAQEGQLVREMGVGTISFWSLLLLAVMAGALVTSELDDKTAVLLLCKPLKRSHFLIGKFLGLWRAVAMGLIFLSLLFFLTLWMREGTGFFKYYDSARTEGWLEYIWNAYLGKTLGFVLQAFFLCLLQGGTMAAICVCLAAFFPVVVSISAAMLLFVLGNISTHFVANLESSGPGVASSAARLLQYVLPNLSYYNLSIHFSEGAAVSAKYLLLTGLYTTMYISLFLWLASAFFEKREVR